MTAPPAPADLLVVDGVASRHGAYRELLDGVVGGVVTVAPGEYAFRLLRERPFAALLMNLDGGSDKTRDDPASALALLDGLSGPPVIFISADLTNVAEVGARLPASFDYLPLPIVPELLRAKVAFLAERAHLQYALSQSGKSNEDLIRQLEQLAEAAGEEKRAVEELKKLVGEQVHRSKNLLAIIQSIALRTINDGRDMAEARSALLGRIRALARAYQLLTAAGGKGTELSDIIEAEVGDIGHRVHATGPSARLAGSFVQTFALAIHELATNATQHGALCNPDGSVNVGWTFFDTRADRYLEVAWTESGGPPVRTPAHYGFGLSLVSSLAGAAQSPITFDENGFGCRMRLSQDMIIPS